MYNGCVYLELKSDNWKSVINIISDDNLYLGESNDSNSYGIELDPHITLLYGLESDTFDERRLFKLVPSIKKFKLKIDGVGIFENENYHVLHFKVSDDNLNFANKTITDNFEYKTDYDDYTPHITIAYLNPDREVSAMYQKLIEYMFTMESLDFIPVPAKYVYSNDFTKKISFVK